MDPFWGVWDESPLSPWLGISRSILSRKSLSVVFGMTDSGSRGFKTQSRKIGCERFENIAERGEVRAYMFEHLSRSCNEAAARGGRSVRQASPDWVTKVQIEALAHENATKTSLQPKLQRAETKVQKQRNQSDCPNRVIILSGD